MSQKINHKTPPAAKPQAGFDPLNQRRTTQTVGTTYGERRQRTPSLPQGTLSNHLLQRTKDFFLGGKKTAPAQDFANKDDRFERAKKSKLEGIEEGLSVAAKMQRPEDKKYVGFLNSVIEYLDVRKKVV